MTYGAMAGILICDLITRNESALMDTYDHSYLKTSRQLRTSPNILRLLNWVQSTNLKEAKARLFAKASPKLPRTERMEENSTSVRPFVRMSAAMCTGICWNDAGIARAGSQFDVDGTNGPAVAPLVERIE